MKKITILVLLLIIIFSFIKINNASAELAQDKRMHVGNCLCDDGYYATGFTCSQPGNECYTSSYCFCN